MICLPAIKFSINRGRCGLWLDGVRTSALTLFGFPKEEIGTDTGSGYEKVLQQLEEFKDEALNLAFLPAAALDAFFFEYAKEHSPR